VAKRLLRIFYFSAPYFAVDLANGLVRDLNNKTPANRLCIAGVPEFVGFDLAWIDV
jgi:hypothetical protein